MPSRVLGLSFLFTGATLGRQTKQLQEKLWFQNHHKISYTPKTMICYGKKLIKNGNYRKGQWRHKLKASLKIYGGGLRVELLVCLNILCDLKQTICSSPPPPRVRCQFMTSECQLPDEGCPSPRVLPFLPVFLVCIKGVIIIFFLLLFLEA